MPPRSRWHWATLSRPDPTSGIWALKPRALGRDLHSEIQEVRSELRQVETRLEAKIETAIASVRVDIRRWLVVTKVALAGFLFAALKLVH